MEEVANKLVMRMRGYKDGTMASVFFEGATLEQTYSYGNQGVRWMMLIN
jgi:hypothetical protein